MATSHARVPGELTPTGMAILETATATVQSFSPINSIHRHLCAFHFYSHHMTRQLEAHHFCPHQNEEMRQCLIYDSPEANAKLVSLEYIISEPLFLTLPDNESFSHEYEVKRGVLFMPGLPGPIQRQHLAKVCKTYGKTIHFWQVDRRDELRLGIPQVMLALTKDGQLRPELATDVQMRYGVSFDEEREKRAYMAGPKLGVHPLANGGGKGLTTELRETDCMPVDSVPRVFLI